MSLYGLQSSLYSASPFTVSRYFCLGCRGLSGYSRHTYPSNMAGERYRFKKLSRPFKFKPLIISFTDNCLLPIILTRPTILWLPVCNLSRTCPVLVLYLSLSTSDSGIRQSSGGHRHIGNKLINSINDSTTKIHILFQSMMLFTIFFVVDK